jgi:hypothetical protein
MPGGTAPPRPTQGNFWGGVSSHIETPPFFMIAARADLHAPQFMQRAISAAVLLPKISAAMSAAQLSGGTQITIGPGRAPP